MKIGDIWVNSWNYEAEILSTEGQKATVKFVDSGNVYSFFKHNIRSGRFSDKIKRKEIKEAKDLAMLSRKKNKRIMGVGYQGEGKYSLHKNPEYHLLWSSMLQRVYSKKRESSLRYYKDVSVDESWHDFQKFCEDIQELPGFDLWSRFEKGPGGRNLYSLDKDMLSEDSKIYSKETCHFITTTENVQEARGDGQGCTTYYLLKDGEVITVVNLIAWCEENNIPLQGMRFMLCGGSKSSSGYVRYTPEISIEDHPKPSEKSVSKREEFLGKEFMTTKSGICVVIEYRKATDVSVLFPETGSVVKTSIYSLKNGNVLDPLRKN